MLKHFTFNRFTIQALLVRCTSVCPPLNSGGGFMGTCGVCAECVYPSDTLWYICNNMHDVHACIIISTPLSLHYAILARGYDDRVVWLYKSHVSCRTVSNLVAIYVQQRS